jgi:SAM-dependent methyltransferase
MSNNRLTNQEYWRDAFWRMESASLPAVEFDPRGLEFRALHRLFQQHLPRGPRRCLEIGCAPGRYLWYFRTQFDYDVTGLEFVPQAAEATRQQLAQAGVPATIITADLFDYQCLAAERFDVVCSFGVVEHFRDIGPVIAKHAELVAPGGLLIIAVPNHVGLNGWILRAIQPEVFRLHNRMNWKLLKSAVEQLGDFEIVAGGYWGHFNLAPSNLLPWWRARVPYWAFRIVEKLHNGLLYCQRMIPNCAMLSPYIGMIAKRVPPKVAQPQ